MTMPEMIERFSPDGLLKKASVFDLKKLEWMNGQHLNMLPLEQVEPLITPAIVDAGLAPRDCGPSRVPRSTGPRRPRPASV